MMTAEALAGLVLQLVALIVNLIGIDKAKALLSLTDAERANSVADVAEYIKFGRLSSSLLAPLPAVAEKLESQAPEV